MLVSEWPWLRKFLELGRYWIRPIREDMGVHKRSIAVISCITWSVLESSGTHSEDDQAID